MTAQDELLWIAQAKAGDLQAFEALYNLHKTAIFRTALALTGDRSLAEEILQETFLRAFQHLPNVREGVSLSPWLYRVAVNLAYDHSAKRRRKANALGKFIDWLMPSVPTPERRLEAQELQDMIYEAIGRLEFRQRTTLVLFYLQDFSMQEIARIMDCPVGTVKSRLHYGRQNLRRELLAAARMPGGLAYELP